jgi:hypothetical protein
MNKLPFLAIATLSVAACSSMPMASTNGPSKPTYAASGEQYCFKRNLAESGGKLYCNWVADRSQACTARADVGVEVARYSDPQPAGRCDTGEYLVKVSPKA